MSTTKTIDKISRKYSLALKDLTKLGMESVLKERRKKLLTERWEILNRYDSQDIKELESKIKKGLIPEHPAWEDLIEAKNISVEVQEIENDLRTIQAA